MNPELSTRLSTVISTATRCQFELRSMTPVGGGSINESFRIKDGNGMCYFLKLNEARYLPIFIAEAAGLNAIAATDTLHVPRPIAHGIADDQSYLVMEYLRLGSRGDVRQLGTQLAALHRCTAQRFGFEQDNFIGTTTQPNKWSDDWASFWCEQRLGFQLRLASEKGYGRQLQDLGGELLDALPVFFRHHTPQPSLLHGDLWGGNHAFLADGTPAVFDPATYYGDRECDLAMTELFGGYPESFYAAYRETWPLQAGYDTRRDLYNLYHILNHANLFGGGYARQAGQMMRRLLAALD